MTDKTKLEDGELHPASYSAKQYIFECLLHDPKDVFIEFLRDVTWHDEDNKNRTIEICQETLKRIKLGEPVGNKYLLGLALMMAILNHRCLARTEK